MTNTQSSTGICFWFSHTYELKVCSVDYGSAINKHQSTIGRIFRCRFRLWRNHRIFTQRLRFPGNNFGQNRIRVRGMWYRWIALEFRQMNWEICSPKPKWGLLLPWTWRMIEKREEVTASLGCIELRQVWESLKSSLRQRVWSTSEAYSSPWKRVHSLARSLLCFWIPKKKLTFWRLNDTTPLHGQHKLNNYPSAP